MNDEMKGLMLLDRVFRYVWKQEEKAWKDYGFMSDEHRHWTETRVRIHIVIINNWDRMIWFDLNNQEYEVGDWWKKQGVNDDN